jgi:hypothetical protein
MELDVFCMTYVGKINRLWPTDPDQDFPKETRSAGLFNQVGLLSQSSVPAYFGSVEGQLFHLTKSTDEVCDDTEIILEQNLL